METKRNAEWVSEQERGAKLLKIKGEIESAVGRAVKDCLTVASRIVFENGHYVVCLTRAGLSVQSKRNGDGRLLADNFGDWLEAFDTAIDRDEAHMLARAIYGGGR